MVCNSYYIKFDVKAILSVLNRFLWVSGCWRGLIQDGGWCVTEQTGSAAVCLKINGSLLICTIYFTTVRFILIFSS